MGVISIKAEPTKSSDQLKLPNRVWINANGLVISCPTNVEIPKGFPFLSLITGLLLKGGALMIAGSVTTTGVIGSKLMAELSTPPNSLLVFPIPTDF